MMIKCTECGKEYSDQAKACVHCGARNPTNSGGCLKAIIGLVVMVVVFAIFVVAIRMYAIDPQEASESEMIAKCREAENDAAISTEIRERVRGACDSMTRKYTDKYGHAP